MSESKASGINIDGIVKSHKQRLNIQVHPLSSGLPLTIALMSLPICEIKMTPFLSVLFTHAETSAQPSLNRYEWQIKDPKQCLRRRIQGL